MMQIAENLVKSGITTGEKFNAKITDFVREHQFTKIIETGTYHGTGTTRAILNGLDGDFDFISIEVNPDNFKQAVQNLGSVSGLHLINGLSVGRSDLPVSLSSDFPDHVIIDHQPNNRWDLYSKEVDYRVSDHQLDRALAAFDYKPDFVLLDSAGHMGLIEFKYLMDRVKGPFYLALDDTDHIKHYKTMELIRAMPQRFEIVWQVRSAYVDEQNGDKFGSAIISVS